MIPISACGTYPPERVQGNSRTRDYTGEISWLAAVRHLARELQIPENAENRRRVRGEKLAGYYNFFMKVGVAIFLAAMVTTHAFAQDAAEPSTPAVSQAEPKSVTVPITLDHYRIVIDGSLALADGTGTRVRVWVDNGNPEMEMSRRVASLLGLNVQCDDKACSAPPPPEITIAGMKISLAAVKETKIPLRAVNAAAVMAPGMNAEINLPSTVLRNYDVLVSFPDRQFTIAQPGALAFRGVKDKVLINAGNGLIQIPSKIENKKYNLGLDLGASISFLSEELFAKLSAAHADWPRMTGAVGPANLWGMDDETKWKLLRVDRVQYGSQFLIDVPVVGLAGDRMVAFEKRAGVATAGLIGSQVLANYRVGIDYAHSAVYFEVGRTFKSPDFDLVGLVLRPEDDGRFTVLGVVDFEGKPSVPEVRAGDHLVAVDGISVTGSTLGQVWSMLRGSPGQERRLTVERDGKELSVAASVRHFLGVAPEESSNKRKSKEE